MRTKLILTKDDTHKLFTSINIANMTSNNDWKTENGKHWRKLYDFQHENKKQVDQKWPNGFTLKISHG